jgi:hypothetical protein
VRLPGYVPVVGDAGMASDHGSLAPAPRDRRRPGPRTVDVRVATTERVLPCALVSGTQDAELPDVPNSGDACRQITRFGGAEILDVAAAGIDDAGTHHLV